MNNIRKFAEPFVFLVINFPRTSEHTYSVGCLASQYHSQSNHFSLCQVRFVVLWCWRLCLLLKQRNNNLHQSRTPAWLLPFCFRFKTSILEVRPPFFCVSGFLRAEWLNLFWHCGTDFGPFFCLYLEGFGLCFLFVDDSWSYCSEALKVGFAIDK